MSSIFLGFVRLPTNALSGFPRTCDNSLRHPLRLFAMSLGYVTWTLSCIFTKMTGLSAQDKQALANNNSRAQAWACIALAIDAVKTEAIKTTPSCDTSSPRQMYRTRHDLPHIAKAACTKMPSSYHTIHSIKRRWMDR